MGVNKMLEEGNRVILLDNYVIGPKGAKGVVLKIRDFNAKVCLDDGAIGWIMEWDLNVVGEKN